MIGYGSSVHVKPFERPSPLAGEGLGRGGEKFDRTLKLPPQPSPPGVSGTEAPYSSPVMRFDCMRRCYSLSFRRDFSPSDLPAGFSVNRTVRTRNRFRPTRPLVSVNS